MHRKKGQSILEYVIVLTVIVAAIAAAANSVINNAVNQGFTDASDTITTATGKLNP